LNECANGGLARKSSPKGTGFRRGVTDGAAKEIRERRTRPCKVLGRLSLVESFNAMRAP